VQRYRIGSSALRGLVICALLSTILVGTVWAKEKVVFVTQAEGIGGDVVIERLIIDEFVRTHNVEVEVIAIPSAEYNAKVINMIIGGTAPDVIYTRADLNTNYVGMGLVQPLSRYINADKSVDLSDFFPAIVRAFTIDGQLYALPRGNQPVVMYYNATALSQAGLSAPDPNWTWEGQFLEYAKRLTVDNNGDGHPDVWGFLDGGVWYWAAVWAFGGSFLDEKESAYTLNRPAGVRAFEFLASLTQVHLVAPGNLGRDAFYQGRGNMVPTDAVASAQLRKMNPGFEWEVVEMPLGPAGRATTLNGAGYSLATGAKNPQLGWELIKALTSEKGIDILTRAYDVGQVVPTRRSVAQSTAFLRADPPPHNRAAFMRALEYAQIIYVGKQKWPRLNSAITPVASAIITGKSGAQQGLDSIASTVASILAE
jgi:multiple sugar transport system substrate-binding protein